MVSVVRSDMRNRRRPLLQLLIVSARDGLLPGVQDLVDLVSRLRPLLGVKVVKVSLLSPRYFGRGLSLEASQWVGVPEQPVIRDPARWNGFLSRIVIPTPIVAEAEQTRFSHSQVQPEQRPEPCPCFAARTAAIIVRS